MSSIISVNAASTTSVPMRYDYQYNIAAPADASYCYYYVITGSGEDFTFAGKSYAVFWSTERLVVNDPSSDTSDDYILFNKPCYVKFFNSLSEIEQTIFHNKTTEFENLYVCTESFEMDNYDVVYSNRSYLINEKSHKANWPYAIPNEHIAVVTTFFGSLYNALSSNKITLFGTELSFFALIIGPFFVSVSIMIMQAIFGVGASQVSAGVRISRNYKKDHSREKKKSE